MAGGVKKPVNIFRLRNLGEPDGVFSWRLWFAVASFALLGAARGIDEGLIAGAFNSPAFKRGIRYDSYSLAARANIKANVSSMVQLGSVAGAFFAFVVCDRLGRIQATRFLCVLWIVGIVIFMVGGAHGNLGAIYAGRLIAGLGVGQTPVVGPIYIAEVAPASIRGLCTCFFTGAVYLGIVLAYFANYGASQHISATSNRQWLVPTSLHVIMAGLILVLMFFQRESPRFLARSGRDAAAARNLARLRRQPVDGAYVTAEMGAVRAALDRELEVSAATSRRGRLAAALGELLCDGANLYRLYLATAAQLLSQWSGAGSVTLYAVDFFRILGVAGRREGLLVTAVFGLVKLVAACVCALFLVDVIGRKRSLILGIALQAISMTYIASFLSALPQLGVVDDFVLPASAAAASRAAIAMVYLSGIGWALGWNSMQYLLTAELFPLRVRALATSWAMTLHFANQYGSSRAVPVMLLPDNKSDGGGDGGIAPRGTFWFFAAVTILGGFWVLVSVPETAGRDLESMDRLFRLPWYKIGLHGNRDAERRDNAAAAIVADDTADAVEMRDDKADGGALQRYGVGGGTAEHIEDKKTPHSVAIL